MVGFLRRRPAKILIDTSLLVGFLLEFFTREGPDYSLHSWVGIVLIPIVVVHLLSNLGWVQRVAKRGRQDREFSLAVLNGVLGMASSVCIGTGFPVWLMDSPPEFWEMVHTITGFVALLLMFVHLWRNRGRIRQLAGRGSTASS